MNLKNNWVYSMNNFSLSEITKNQFLDSKYDLALFFSSSDSRCSFIASNLKVGFSKTKILFKTDSSTPSSSFGAIESYSLIDGNGSDFSVVYSTLNDMFLTDGLYSNYRVFVDYSSIPKEYLAVICYFFFKGPKRHLFQSGFVCDFGYSIGQYNEIKSLSEFSEPIILPGCEGLPLTKQKRATVFVLGFDPFGPYAIFNTLNPEKSFSVVATSGDSLGYESAVLKFNSDFINNTTDGSSGIIKLPLSSVSSIYSGFSELLAPMKDCNLTFALFGPKTHTLAAILLSMTNASITCMYCKSKEESTRIAFCSGEYVVSRISF